MVVLRHPLAAAAGRAGLELAGGEADGEAGDRGVLGLAGAVRAHDTPAVLLGELDRGDIHVLNLVWNLLVVIPILCTSLNLEGRIMSIPRHCMSSGLDENPPKSQRFRCKYSRRT